MPRKSIPPGRPLEGDEPLDVGRQVSFSASMYQTLKEMAAARTTEAGRTISVGRVVRDLVEQALAPAEPASPVVMNVAFYPLVDTVPAGPWTEAIDRAERVMVPDWMAADLSMREEDLLFRVDGQSMEEAGIPDGAWVVVRPDVRPRRTDACVVEIEREDGTFESTLKHFHAGDPHPRLTNGAGEDWPMPEDTVRVRPVGVVRAVFHAYN